MKKDRQNNRKDFDKWTERNGLQLLRNGIVFCGTDQNRAVRPEMFGKKSTNGIKPLKE
jgi:hypothetical protein